MVLIVEATIDPVSLLTIARLVIDDHIASLIDFTWIIIRAAFAVFIAGVVHAHYFTGLGIDDGRARGASDGIATGLRVTD